jgi:hypothetical protein
MRSEIFRHSMQAIALASLTLVIGAGSAVAQARAPAAAPAGELPPDREEIIITHQRLGPLSEWAAMQQHSADYRRLKAKYDPTTGSSHVDNWATDRALAAPGGTGGGFEAESAAAGTAPAVQAIKDAVVPP